MPPVLKNVATRQMIRALEQDGFTRTRQSGSHAIYLKEARRVVVAIHSLGDTIPLGTLRRMCRDAGWEEDDLRRLELLK
jgi:predicted RNA binding protein YcfA (HicA-like mRNA interferase family)